MNKRLLLGLKILLGILLLAVIYRQLTQNGLPAMWLDFTQQMSLSKLPLLLLAIALMPLNWLLESYKWGFLLNKNYDVKTLLRGVIAGVTFGFVTPARSGEFLGRVLFLQDVDRVRSFYLCALGGMAQAVITYTMGVLCLGIVGGQLFNDWQTPMAVATGMAAVFLLFYFRFDWLNALLRKLGFLSRLKLLMSDNDIPSPDLLIKTLGLAFIRYIVYVAQYVLLALFFCKGGEVTGLIICTGLFLLLQSISPLTPFLDVPLRGVMALAVFGGLLQQNKMGILMMVAMALVVNLAVPALLGYFFILNRRLPNNRELIIA